MRKAIIETLDVRTTRLDRYLIISNGNIGGKFAHYKKGEVQTV